MKNVLVTGGAGYIGSHTIIELLENNYKVYVLDNLVNSNIKVLDRINKIVGQKKYKNFYFYKNDLTKKISLKKKLNEIGKIDICIHFAGLKAVGESVENPLLYYNTNILSTLNLLECLEYCNCKKIIFSSSATVYGNSKSPLKEDSIVGNGLTNPYGKTKYMIEEILKDYSSSRKDFSVICLRYFNPIGAHPSGLIGENPNGIPNNLMPYIQQVLVGKREKLTIFGNDYQTKDGTGVRDYIHVVDLAKGHLAAVNKINKDKTGFFVYNLGNGKGYSVLDLVKMTEKLSGEKIPYVIGNRRKGDIDIVFCDPSKAKKNLKWSTEKNLEDMCRDSINWQINNINGY